MLIIEIIAGVILLGSLLHGIAALYADEPIQRPKVKEQLLDYLASSRVAL